MSVSTHQPVFGSRSHPSLAAFALAFSYACPLMERTRQLSRCGRSAAVIRIRVISEMTQKQLPSVVETLMPRQWHLANGMKDDDDI